MDTNILMVIDWLYKTIGVDFVNNWIKILFTTACTVTVCMMLSLIIVVVNLADLIRLPLKETPKEHVSMWQTVKRWFPKKKSEVQES